jgi:hypothetical protein
MPGLAPGFIAGFMGRFIAGGVDTGGVETGDADTGWIGDPGIGPPGR